MPRALSILVLVAVALGAAPPPGRTPVLVELFTSEGCSSCPPADALLARLVNTQGLDGVQVIALELHVDYWDRLGWKDPFSAATFTRRQQDYSLLFGGDRVYTPQAVVDGTVELVGGDEPALASAVRTAAREAHLAMRVHAVKHGPAVRVSIDAPARPGDSEKVSILVALVEDGLVSVVRRGENGGRTLAHAAVVRTLSAVGALDRDAFVAEGALRIDPSWKGPNLRVVAFLQGVKSRRVYGAAQAPIGADSRAAGEQR